MASAFGPLTQGTIMYDGGNTADEFGAHLCQSRHWCDQEGIQTHVMNHFLTSLLCLRLVTMETWKLRVFGNENQLSGQRNKVLNKIF